MKKILTYKIENKNVLKLSKNFDIVAFILCLFSFYLTYYYYKSFNPIVLNISLFLFQTGLSLKIGSFISGVIIQNELK